ncbi:asparagine synthase (glutamine-hydrolyzing) [Vibrio coralliilyticus]|uniref:asparagine synthase (glutamine-hydrolyzing) n=1 Tax=Vibrio coralliilyticus TaxID=190893 RepID=UPI00181B97B7|nr:asparagine synthase (glutamine-hydrolyzing) [Vibrio coralliilyticus]NUW68971.1 asparagine synthase (glutamine-hydrolyzing) [Vibrio coralliilyticus]
MEDVEVCGIFGIVTPRKFESMIKSKLSLAEKAQHHRGPDIIKQEVFSCNNWSLGLSHQRLSILDLSDAGAQPMKSSSNRSTIIYNGEVYNYKEISEELNDIEFNSSTDTEVVVNAIEKFGINNALKKFNGMWAFAWFSQDQNKIYLCRDRAGVKPLYYTIKKGSLYFSSEVKSILESVGDKFDLNIQAVGEYIYQANQDTENNSFFSEINSVPAGHYVSIDLSKAELELELHRYWNVLDAEPFVGEDLETHVKELFFDAVNLRLRSDVPVGVTLSGGLDSSAIASAMKSILGSAENLNILSAVAPHSDMDESEFIDEMVSYLQADVHKIKMEWEAKDALDLLRIVTWHNDSPAGSFSNVAHYLMMKEAHNQGITVILSGQGADELLCGYKKYLGFYIQHLVRTNKLISAFKVLGEFFINRSVINQFNVSEAKRYLPKFLVKREIDIGGVKLKSGYAPKNSRLKKAQSVQQRQAEDLESFSVPYLTHYEDRMSMAWSREIRLPFLDYRLMELFINLPIKKKIFNGWTKYIFRRAMIDILPDKICWRKDKQGFVSPQEKWLKDELKDDVLKIFSPDALIFKMGLIDRNNLLEKYHGFVQGESNIWYREIFAPLALEIWLQINKAYILEK